MAIRVKTKKKDGDVVTAVLTKATGKEKIPYRKLRVEDCVPNDWNANRVDQAKRIKLTKGIKDLLDLVGVVPPIVVRPHPEQDGKFQIIDGFHRWDIFRAESIEMIDAYVINVDTKMAMILTDTLNYLRGEPDPDAQAAYLHRLMTENDMTPVEVAEYLPDTQQEIEQTLADYDLQVVPVDVPDGESVVDDKEDAPDELMELKFGVYRSQAEVIEAEIARIGALLKGKNVRGRALEFIAVNSSQTPIESIEGLAPPASEPLDEEAAEEEDEEEKEKPKVLDIKVKLKKKAQR